MLVLVCAKISAIVFPVPDVAPFIAGFEAGLKVKVVPLTEDVSAMLVFCPEQIVAGFGVAITSGVGCMVMLAFAGVPGHIAPLELGPTSGVIVNVAVCVVFPELFSVIAGMLSPVPDVGFIPVTAGLFVSDQL